MLLLPLNNFLESFMFRIRHKKSPSYRVIKNGNLGRDEVGNNGLKSMKVGL